MPAFIFQTVQFSVIPQLSNIGNGGALNIVISPLSFASNGERDIHISFKSMVYMPTKDTSSLELTAKDASNLELTLNDIALKTACSKKLYEETYDLVVDFQDIEGRAYKQILRMEKAHCRPQPVTAVSV